jgi:hypothetical protein
MAFQRKNHIRCKIAIENKTVEHVSTFDYLGLNASYCPKEEINIKNTKLRGFGPPSELCRPRDRRLFAMLVPTFADRGCRVVTASDSHGR